MAKIISPIELWKDVVIESETNESVLKEYEKNGIIYKEVYFNGQKKEQGVTRVYGILARPNNNDNCPCVLLCHDSNHTVDIEYIDYFAKQGFAVFMCDMYGEQEKSLYTFFPDDLVFANRKNNEDGFYQVGDEMTNTYVFQCILLQRYALNYLRQQREINVNKIGVIGIRDGSIIAWQLAHLEEYLACAVSLFYAGWREFGRNYSDSESIENLSEDKMAYIACISPQSCAQFIKTPMLYLSSSNDVLGNLDRSFDTMARINGRVSSLTYISPNEINNLDYHATMNLKVWLNVYLKDKNLDYIDKPIITVENISNQLLAKCFVEEPAMVKKVTIYYAEGNVMPAQRCYQKRELSLSGEGFVGIIEECTSDEMLFAFANVEYTNGYTITSNFLAVELDDLGLVKNLTKQSLIYNGLMGEDTFSGITQLEDMTVSGTFIEEPTVKMKEGASGIMGITSTLNLATFKLSHPAYQGENGQILMLDLCCEEPLTVEVVAYSNLGEDNSDKYVATLLTVGGPLWQNFKLQLNDFKNGVKASLDNWSEVSLLVFKCDGDFMLNNMIWV